MVSVPSVLGRSHCALWVNHICFRQIIHHLKKFLLDIFSSIAEDELHPTVQANLNDGSDPATGEYNTVVNSCLQRCNEIFLNLCHIVKNPFGMIDTLFKIFVWRVTISD